VIVADTSGLLALFNRREPRHDEVRRVVEAETEPLVVSPFW
jgi:predicted nucleic acid-binding protein